MAYLAYRILFIQALTILREILEIYFIVSCKRLIFLIYKFFDKSMGILEKIKEIEDEMARTQKNKATEYHIGNLKARLAKLRT